MKAALKEEQGKSQSMGMVVKYLENAKETLEKEKQALSKERSTEVSFRSPKIRTPIIPPSRCIRFSRRRVCR